ncbi:MAG TPA: hypothetical protein PK514_15070 [Spirochaetota bacterium]|nr:hypothetical protein [Spirochaetota bacterium]
MKIYRAAAITIFISLFLLGAGWDRFSVKVTGSGPSDEKDSTRYSLIDGTGKAFEVNYSTMPDESGQKRVIELKDTFYSWKRIKVDRMQFYFSTDAIYSNLETGKITYNEEDLLPYLPAGLSFQDKKEGLYYRFRIIDQDKSYMLQGIYTDEETFLKTIYNFIKKRENTEQSFSVKEIIPDGKTSGGKTPGGTTYDDKTPGETYNVEKTPDETVADKKKRPVVKKETATGDVHPRLSVFLLGNYMMPRETLAEIFSSGYGATAGLTLHNTGISLNDRTLFNMDLSLAAGFTWLVVKDDLDITMSSNVDKAFIIPVLLYARFPFEIYRGFFIAPLFSVGYNYNSIDFTEPVSTGGYAAVKIREWAPSLSAGLQFGFPVIRDRLTILAGAEYSAVFEREMTSKSFVFHLGVEYSFMTFGD